MAKLNQDQNKAKKHQLKNVDLTISYSGQRVSAEKPDHVDGSEIGNRRSTKAGNKNSEDQKTQLLSSLTQDTAVKSLFRTIDRSKASMEKLKDALPSDQKTQVKILAQQKAIADAEKALVSLVKKNSIYKGLVSEAVSSRNFPGSRGPQGGENKVLIEGGVLQDIVSSLKERHLEQLLRTATKKASTKKNDASTNAHGVVEKGSQLEASTGSGQDSKTPNDKAAIVQMHIRNLLTDKKNNRDVIDQITNYDENASNAAITKLSIIKKLADKGVLVAEAVDVIALAKKLLMLEASVGTAGVAVNTANSAGVIHKTAGELAVEKGKLFKFLNDSPEVLEDLARYTSVATATDLVSIGQAPAVRENLIAQLQPYKILGEEDRDLLDRALKLSIDRQALAAANKEAEADKVRPETPRVEELTELDKFVKDNPEFAAKFREGQIAQLSGKDTGPFEKDLLRLIPDELKTGTTSDDDLLKKAYLAIQKISPKTFEFSDAELERFKILKAGNKEEWPETSKANKSGKSSLHNLLAKLQNTSTFDKLGISSAAVGTAWAVSITSLKGTAASLWLIPATSLAYPTLTVASVAVGLGTGAMILGAGYLAIKGFQAFRNRQNSIVIAKKGKAVSI